MAADVRQPAISLTAWKPRGRESKETRHSELEALPFSTTEPRRAAGHKSELLRSGSGESAQERAAGQTPARPYSLRDTQRLEGSRRGAGERGHPVIAVPGHPSTVSQQLLLMLLHCSSPVDLLWTNAAVWIISPPKNRNESGWKQKVR